MPIDRLLPFVLVAVATVARAQSPDAQTIDFPKNMEIPATVTLLKSNGAKPAGKPFEDGRAVELRFNKVVKSTPQTVPCTLNVPKKIGQVAPGEAAVIGIKCSEIINLSRDQLGFKLIDAGREVGSGAFRP